MFITVPKWRCACSGPLIFLAFAVAMISVSLREAFVGGLTLRSAVFLVVSCAIGGVVLAGFRFARLRRNGRLIVRTAFGSEGVSGESCAFGISVAHGARGQPTFTVYATDRAARVNVADFWTKRGAERARVRLERCFVADPASSDRRFAQGRVEQEQGRWESDYAAAQAKVNEYYASATHKRLGYLMVGGLLVYILVMLLISWITGKPL
jgi:hypothetical protein